ncbi:hypothetical protein E4T56_gene7039 [Termitomyces sp. T112]|nr:hypothetical protein E4T56_gene7039 [Termitomyces sp. T112]
MEDKGSTYGALPTTPRPPLWQATLSTAAPSPLSLGSPPHWAPAEFPTSPTPPIVAPPPPLMPPMASFPSETHPSPPPPYGLPLCVWPTTSPTPLPNIAGKPQQLTTTLLQTAQPRPQKLGNTLPHLWQEGCPLFTLVARRRGPLPPPTLWGPNLHWGLLHANSLLYSGTPP